MESVFGQVVLVVGDEEFLVEREITNWSKAAKSQEPDVELRELEAANLTVGDFTEAVGGSLFSPYSVVVIRELGQLPEQLRESVLDAVQNPNPQVCLLLTHPGGVKGAAFITQIKRAKPRLVEATFNKRDAVSFVVAEGKNNQIRVDTRAARVLVDTLGSDLRTLAQAVAQLAADLDGKPLTAQLVSTYFAGRAEISGFKMSDDLLGGKLDEALAQLRWGLTSGVSPAMFTAALAGGLRSLGKYQTAASRRLPAEQLAQQVGVPRWKLKTLGSLAKTWTSQALASSIDLVAKADAAVKGGGADPGYVLENLLLQIHQLHRGTQRH